MMRVVLGTGLVLCLASMNAARADMDAAASKSILDLPSQDQAKLLRASGCDQTMVGDAVALASITQALNAKYLSITNFSALSADQHQVVKELVRANNCLGYFGGQPGVEAKYYYLSGCDLSARLAGVADPAVAYEARLACVETREMSAAERDKIKAWALKGWEDLAVNAQRRGDGRRNFYQYMLGMRLCSMEVDCARGLSEMYEAALAEYQQNGVERFDEDMAQLLGELYAAAFSQRDPHVYRFVTDLQVALQQSGRRVFQDDLDRAKGIFQRVLERWSAEGITAAGMPKPLTLSSEAQPPQAQLEAGQVPDSDETAAPEAEAPAGSMPWCVAASIIVLAIAIFILLRRRKDS